MSAILTDEQVQWLLCWDRAAGLKEAARLGAEIERERWRSIAEDGPPEPEVFVLCWDGRTAFVDWFGSKPDAGRGVTHWMPFPTPPGTLNPMFGHASAIRARAGKEGG